MKIPGWILEVMVFAAVVACVIALEVGVENVDLAHVVVFVMVVVIGGAFIKKFLSQKND